MAEESTGAEAAEEHSRPCGEPKAPLNLRTLYTLLLLLWPTLVPWKACVSPTLPICFLLPPAPPSQDVDPEDGSAPQDLGSAVMMMWGRGPKPGLDARKSVVVAMPGAASASGAGAADALAPGRGAPASLLAASGQQQTVRSAASIAVAGPSSPAPLEAVTEEDAPAGPPKPGKQAWGDVGGPATAVSESVAARPEARPGSVSSTAAWAGKAAGTGGLAVTGHASSRAVRSPSSPRADLSERLIRSRSADRIPDSTRTSRFGRPYGSLSPVRAKAETDPDPDSVVTSGMTDAAAEMSCASFAESMDAGTLPGLADMTPRLPTGRKPGPVVEAAGGALHISASAELPGAPAVDAADTPVLKAVKNGARPRSAVDSDEVRLGADRHQCRGSLR